ncbi:amidase [Microbacterium kribbense]|uniref:Amidase n=1 Tax=Microbacterium kribbense TaxID=433645 RepID=A0ABP7GYG1_9MICO
MTFTVGAIPDVTETARKIASGEISSIDVVNRALARIAEVDADIGAFTVVLTDEARSAAVAADNSVAAGEPIGPLHGVPIAVKDHIWMRGVLATNGSRAYKHFRPSVDAVPVARLRTAGAVLIGKTNNPEFCYRGFTDNAVWGPTRNPYDLERTPGGSSGGSAAAVAAGMVAGALGTDGGGSIRLPAAFCGVTGHKPTFGVVPKDPGFRGWKSLSVTGPIARSVRDCALLMDVIAGADPADDLSFPNPRPGYSTLLSASTTTIGALRIAYSHDLGFAPVDEDVRQRFSETIEHLREAGLTLTDAHPSTGDPNDLWNDIAVCEGFSSEGVLLAEWEDAMTPGTASIIRAGEHKSAADYLDAIYRRSAFTERWLRFFGEFDILLTPTAQVTAFPLGRDTPETAGGLPVDPFFDAWSAMFYPANLAGLPATTIPVGLSSHGLPIGLQVMGGRFDDARVLAAAAFIERLCAGSVR